MSVKSNLLTTRILQTHMYGITDTTFNMTVRKLIHNYAKNMAYSKSFPYIYLFKAGHTSTSLRNVFIDRLTNQLFE